MSTMPLYLYLQASAQYALEGVHGSLDILATPACNRAGKMPSKEDKVLRFTCPFDSCGCVA